MQVKRRRLRAVPWLQKQRPRHGQYPLVPGRKQENQRWLAGKSEEMARRLSRNPRALQLQVINQARIPQPCRSQHHQRVICLGQLQIALAAQRNIVRLPAALAQRVHGLCL